MSSDDDDDILGEIRRDNWNESIVAKRASQKNDMEWLNMVKAYCIVHILPSIWCGVESFTLKDIDNGQLLKNSDSYTEQRRRLRHELHCIIDLTGYRSRSCGVTIDEFVTYKCRSCGKKSTELPYVQRDMPNDGTAVDFFYCPKCEVSFGDCPIDDDDDVKAHKIPLFSDMMIAQDAKHLVSAIASK